MRNIWKKNTLSSINNQKKNSKILVFRSMILIVLFSVILVLGTIGIGSNGSSSSLAMKLQNHVVYAQNLEDCFDGIDNDGDLAIDTNDSDCSGTSSSTAAETTPSGAQNPETFNSLASAQSNICNPSSPTLRIAAKGPEVTNLQKILIQLGYSVGPKGPDGDFGRATQAAIVKFQQENGLKKIDGEVGPETWNALCSMLSSSTTPTTPTTPSPSQPSNTGYVKCTRPGDDPDSLRAFINNPEASTLDFLPKNLCLEFRNLQWDYYDYYGGKDNPLMKDGKPITDKHGNTKEPEGPNEKRVPAMIAGLKKENKESRVTVEESGVPAGTAVLCVKCSRADPHLIIQRQGDSEKRTISPALWSWIQTQLDPVPDTGKAAKQLNKYAAEAFQKMRDDAKKEGINLVILAGDGAAFRSKTAADTGCSRAGNSFAVACFPNSHNLGLAVDLRMSYPGHRYEEATTLGTYGMQNVVDMRQSPVHKWLFLNAEKYGFYPFTHEPWHWEYNPPNFADTFFAGAPG